MTGIEPAYSAVASGWPACRPAPRSCSTVVEMEHGYLLLMRVGDVRGQILSVCVDSPSVAELAAHLSLSLGVACVLIGNLVTQGYLRSAPNSAIQRHTTNAENS
jgi:Protein of unknown function (DUF742)